MESNTGETEYLDEYVKAQQFYFLTEQCLNLIKKTLSSLLKEFGLNHSQYLILVILRYADLKNNRVISTEISYLLGLEKHSITSIVDSLCKAGYVKRERGKDDRRVIFLELTEKGKTLIEALQPRTIKPISVFPECTAAEFKTMSEFLEKLRVLAAVQNGQQPEAYQKAYKKLILDGEEEFLRLYQKD